MITQEELCNAIESLIDDLDEIEESDSFQRCIVLSELEMQKIRSDESIIVTWRGQDYEICRCEW